MQNTGLIVSWDQQKQNLFELINCVMSNIDNVDSQQSICLLF